jgi:hypothetical protein
MPAAVQMTSARVQYGAHVAVGGGVATLLASAGGVVSVTRNSAGNLTVTLKAPGVVTSGPPLHGPLVLVSPIAAAFANVVASMATPTTVTVLTFDAAGAALDNVSFVLLIVDSERAGGA